MPSEMTEFSSELLVWLVLGVLCLSLAANAGATSLQTSLQHRLQVLAGYLADNVDIAGSRRVEVTVRLPEMLDGHTYSVQTEARAIVAESEGLRATQNTRYPMSKRSLQPGGSYLIKVGDTMDFQEAGR